MAQEEEVNYNRLVQIYQQEKKGGPPIHLVADFHDRVRDYMAKLRASYDQERSKDPSSMKALQLADQLQKVRALQLDILNARLRKFLLLAHQTLTSGMVDTKNFTPEERELFEAMVAELCKGRNRIIDGSSAPSASAGTLPVPPGPLPTPQTRAVCEAPLKASERPSTKGVGLPQDGKEGAAGSLPPGKPAEAGEPVRREKAPVTGAAPEAFPTEEGPMVVVRILEDLPDFAFGDRGGYSLKKKDVVALPRDIAAVLQAHKKAKPVS